jgi:hypothetical protein
VIEWTTATELNSAGFNVYRSESRVGIFAKINAQLIPASNDALVGGNYRYEDTEVTPGKTYYYQLEEVERNGATSRFKTITVTAYPSLDFTGGILILLEIVLLALLGISIFARRRAKAVQTNDVS